MHVTFRTVSRVLLACHVPPPLYGAQVREHLNDNGYEVKVGLSHNLIAVCGRCTRRGKLGVAVLASAFNKAYCPTSS